MGMNHVCFSYDFFIVGLQYISWCAGKVIRRVLFLRFAWPSCFQNLFGDAIPLPSPLFPWRLDIMIARIPLSPHLWFCYPKPKAVWAKVSSQVMHLELQKRHTKDDKRVAFQRRAALLRSQVKSFLDETVPGCCGNLHSVVASGKCIRVTFSKPTVCQCDEHTVSAPFP